MAGIGAIVEGKYEIIKEIGRGGMSVVYLAKDIRLNKQWAVKEIKKEGNTHDDQIVVNSLLAEVNLMKKLDHSALPRIVDIIDEGMNLLVVMDYIEGESLESILEKYGPRPEKVVVEWAKQLCEALSYLHSQTPPIIYRDMKPANVMLKPEGTIKIIDFGIAREYKEHSLKDTTILGTQGYAPPEQYGSQTDARSDIFALGMTMHHLLTGIDPRQGEKYSSVRLWNPHLSESMEAIIDKCVQPSADKRYQSCQELLYDLEHPELMTKSHKKKQKRKLGIFLCVLLLSILCFFAGNLLNRASKNTYKKNYNEYISVSMDASYEMKMHSYRKALEIYPDKPEAYVKILEAYEDEGIFGIEQADEFLELYTEYGDRLDATDREIAEINYKLGVLFFSYYEEDGEPYSFSYRVDKAFLYFQNNMDAKPDNFDHFAASQCHYNICDLYMSYEPENQGDTGITKDDYDKLFEEVRTVISSDEGIDDYDRLSIYNGVLSLINQQRHHMCRVNVDKEEVNKLMDEVYEGVTLLDLEREKSKELQQRILTDCEEYKEAIDSAYFNYQDTEGEE